MRVGTSHYWVEGPNLALRLIKADDAEYVFELRANPKLNEYMSPVKGTVADQRLWIERYKNREANEREYYYVIERKDGMKCGLVRLYNIQGNQFTWGSWMLDDNKTSKAALESAVLSFGIGFEILGFGVANVEVCVQNNHAEKFYRRFGMIESYRNGKHIYFSYVRSQFDKDKPRYMAILGSGTHNV
ncbi:MAG: GNAT family N-acetyltransferase [Pseudomonadota bacterium]